MTIQEALAQLLDGRDLTRGEAPIPSVGIVMHGRVGRLFRYRYLSEICNGIFTVGDVTPDPTTGRTPTEHERIKATVEIAKKAEEVGLDVFATGEHHNPPFVPSSPTTQLGFIAAKTSKIILSTSTTLITTNDPVKIAEDYAFLQHLAGGRVDLMMGRGNTGPVYPWFGQDIRNGIPLAIENVNSPVAAPAS